MVEAKDYIEESSKNLNSKEVKKRDFSSKFSKSDFENNFLGERFVQRDGLLKFATRMSYLSFTLLVVVIVGQFLGRILIETDFEIISDQGLTILATAIFGEILGIVYIIASSLWNNEEFKLIKRFDNHEK